MKKLFYFLTAMFLIMGAMAQNPGDTIVVQTFDYSMTYGQAWGPPRDTIAHFPNNPNLTFEKIIMSYSMRCKNGLVNTSGGGIILLAVNGIIIVIHIYMTLQELIL